MFDIDYVFPYVNNKELVWKEEFKRFCLKTGNTSRLKGSESERYDDFDLLPIVIKSIQKNLPWIRKIHLIVSNIEQVPSCIDREKVNVVLHKDIIPKVYLPTYNSTTIEMYLRRIPDLAEHFIYSNDDIFILNEMKPSDFFTTDGLVRINFQTIKRNKLNQFNNVCYNNYKDVLSYLGYPYDENRLERPYHTITPMIKSHCNDCLEHLGKIIFNSNITPFRNSRQHNQYLYPLWEKYNYDVKHSDVVFQYVSMVDSLDHICETISNKNVDVLCFNDCSSDHRGFIIRSMQKIKDCLNDRLK